MITDMILDLFTQILTNVINVILGQLVMPVFLVDAFDFLGELIRTGAGPFCYILGPTIFRMYLLAVIDIWGAKLVIMIYKSVRNLTL